MKFKHLFGPVSSRRLGISLGVDFIPFKFCPLDCVYCEVQSSKHHTLERYMFYPSEEINQELDIFLATKPKLDYITFSGAGEPTLYSGIGMIIEHLKHKHPEYKIALITNSILLNQNKVRNEILDCDVILPSLDAVSQDVFEKINRPIPSFLADDLVSGLISFRRVFNGQIWLEVFIVPGINDTVAEINKIKEAIKKINPDLVQINSLDRPGTEDWVVPASPDCLQHIQAMLSNGLPTPVEIIAQHSPDHTNGDATTPQVKEQIEKALCYKEASLEDIAMFLDIHINELSLALRQLLIEGRVEVSTYDSSASHEQGNPPSGVYYIWKT